MVTTHPTTPASRSERQQERRQAINQILAATLEVLNAGVATRLPIVQTAFGSAAKIVEISQKVRANQDEFAELAEEGCRLVYIISLKLGDTHEIELNLKANLEELLHTLQSIQNLGEKCAARGTIKAVLMSGFDNNEIEAQRRKLERCIRLFEFQSLLELREKTNELVKQQSGGHGGAGAVHRSTDPENTHGVSNFVSIGNSANFSHAIGIALGVNQDVNVNLN